MSFENTKNYSDFLRYKSLKEEFVFTYKGINVTRGAAFTILNIIMFGKKTSLSNLWFALKKQFLRIDAYRILNTLNEGKTVITEIAGRSDYNELLSLIAASLKRSEIIPLYPHKRVLYCNLSSLCRSLWVTLFSKSLQGFNLSNRVEVGLELSYYCNQIDILSKVRQRIGPINIHARYIPLNSAVGEEAIITLFLNSIDIPTFHIFHGIFGRYKINIANDVINGENITAQKILPFSQVMKEDLVRDFSISLDRVFIAGNPKYPLKSISITEQFKKCIVLNGFAYYDQDFLKLLTFLDRIALELSIEIHIKPHPASKILTYLGENEFENLNWITERITISELMRQRQFDFAITFNTVTYYECMYFDLIAFRYRCGENIDFIGLDDKFSDHRTFLCQLNHFKALDNKLLNKNIQSLLVDVLGMGINNYSAIVES